MAHLSANGPGGRVPMVDVGDELSVLVVDGGRQLVQQADGQAELVSPDGDQVRMTKVPVFEISRS